MEDPGYDGAKEAFQFHRFTLETLPVYETGAEFSQLEKMKSRLIYVTPSHQSPIWCKHVHSTKAKAHSMG